MKEEYPEMSYLDILKMFIFAKHSVYFELNDTFGIK